MKVTPQLASPVAAVAAVALLSIIATLCIESRARAHELISNDEFVLELDAWAQAGYFVEHAPDDTTSHGTYLGMARLASLATYRNLGSAFVQLEANSGRAELLDVIAEVRPTTNLYLRAGRFRVPTSADQQIAAPFTPFVNRALLVEDGFVPTRRDGTEAEGRFDIGSSTLSARAGLFAPSGSEQERLGDSLGTVVSAQVLWETDWGLSLHVAYADFVLASNRFDPDFARPDDAPLPPRPVQYDSLFDAAVMLRALGWTAYLETVVSFDGPDETNHPFAAYVMVLKSIDIPGTTQALEPGVRYDLTHSDITTHRMTVGLNHYLVGDFLNTSFNYELLVEDNQIGHTALAQLQAGF